MYKTTKFILWAVKNKIIALTNPLGPLNLRIIIFNVLFKELNYDFIFSINSFPQKFIAYSTEFLEDIDFLLRYLPLSICPIALYDVEGGGPYEC